MNSFLRNLTTNDVLGENEMPAHSTSESFVLDLFFLLGTRPKSLGVLPRAFAEDPQLTMRALFQSRDIRGGKGERDSFRKAWLWLAKEHPDQVAGLVPYIPEYGRWDDLHTLLGTPLEDAAVKRIISGLTSRDALCAKWQPRKGPIAEKLRLKLELTPKRYRKTLVDLTKVVETQMCAQKWPEINYNHVPSQASRIYAKAFHRHDEKRYDEWREELKKPAGESKAKINVGAIYPHEIVKQAENDGTYPFEQAWERLLETFPPVAEKIITVCDVSGSMSGLPMEVCVSLGLFFSQRNTGPYKDCFITFSAHPALQRLKGSLRDRINQLERSQWDMNTNLEAVFALVARAAAGAQPEDVPSIILIISDMQFDQCVENRSNNAFQMADRMFAAVGAKRPKIVFWNLREEGGKTLPVKSDQSGTALVSGFSPSLMKAFLNNPTDFTPMGIMLNTLNTPRYEQIKL